MIFKILSKNEVNIGLSNTVSFSNEIITKTNLEVNENKCKINDIKHAINNSRVLCCSSCYVCFYPNIFCKQLITYLS